MLIVRAVLFAIGMALAAFAAQAHPTHSHYQSSPASPPPPASDYVFSAFA